VIQTGCQQDATQRNSARHTNPVSARLDNRQGLQLHLLEISFIFSLGIVLDSPHFHLWMMGPKPGVACRSTPFLIAWMGERNYWMKVPRFE